MWLSTRISVGPSCPLQMGRDTPYDQDAGMCRHGHVSPRWSVAFHRRVWKFVQTRASIAVANTEIGARNAAAS